MTKQRALAEFCVDVLGGNVLGYERLIGLVGASGIPLRPKPQMRRMLEVLETFEPNREDLRREYAAIAAPENS